MEIALGTSIANASEAVRGYEVGTDDSFGHHSGSVSGVEGIKGCQMAGRSVVQAW